MASRRLIESIAVTAELCGKVFSEAAARVFVSDLDGYDEHAVIGALTRCRKEVRGLLTVGDVISRLDDGRPGPEEAWAMCPKDEDVSAVMTQEMAESFGVASSLISSGDLVQARMAFLEKYRSLVSKSREEKNPVSWFPSLGNDKGGRASVLIEAVKLGRISSKRAESICYEVAGDLDALGLSEDLPLGFVKGIPDAS